MGWMGHGGFGGRSISEIKDLSAEKVVFCPFKSACLP
jgi:hypothetical protein